MNLGKTSRKVVSGTEQESRRTANTRDVGQRTGTQARCPGTGAFPCSALAWRGVALLVPAVPKCCAAAGAANSNSGTRCRDVRCGAQQLAARRTPVRPQADSRLQPLQHPVVQGQPDAPVDSAKPLLRPRQGAFARWVVEMVLLHVTMRTALVVVVVLAAASVVDAKPVRFDQRQNGSLNVQVDLKDLEVYAIVEDEQLEGAMVGNSWEASSRG